MYDDTTSILLNYKLKLNYQQINLICAFTID